MYYKYMKIPLNGQTIQLKKFDLKIIEKAATICMIAKRNSGKSWVVRDIIWHKRNTPGGVIISPTDKMSSFYGDFFPSLYIHYKYHSSILENVLYRQRCMLDKLKEKEKIGKKFDPHTFLVMDDCMADKDTWKKDQVIQEIFMNGRHYKLMFILTMQYSLGISPELRSNFDYIFLLADDFLSNQKRLYDHYAGMFPSFDAFRTVFMECTKDYGCMVINNRIKSSAQLEDKVFWFKAENRGAFTVGCKQFRDFSVANFDPLYDKRPKLFDIADLQRNKKQPINVTKI